ncbi:MAG: DUF5916 domain-containing protein [Bacteroidales bacterium]|jgi:hypothetical protein
MKRIIILTLIVSLFITSGFGQIVRKQYTATRIMVPPVINGILDDEAWQAGTWAGGFTQNQPYDGRPESQRTEFKILFDDNNLYVAIKAYDTSPDSIVNRLTRRDEQDGDLVGIILDSFHDLRTGFLFGVSSTGVKYDHLMTNDGQDEDPTWDPNWWVKTSVNSEGWIAEMKIPFSQVRFEKKSGDIWGFDVGRVLFRKNETTYWQPIPRDASGLMHLFGELKGLERIEPRKIFDVTPYGVARTETFQAVPGNPFLANGKLSAINGGIDAKIGVTNNLTMDLTINPDFGQVEADPSEVNLSAFETFFAEKRPFFIEGSNITNFSLGIGDGEVGNDNLFYSRRIGRQPHGYPDLKDGWHADVPVRSTILGAAKLTGKTKNGLSVGFIEVMTAHMKAEIDTVGGRMSKTVEPLTNYFVGRMQKDINNGNTLIGGILTSANRELDADVSDFMHKAAYSCGADFTQYFKEKNWMFNLSTAFSLVEGSKKAIENTQKSSAHYFQRPDNNYSVLDTTRTSLAGSGGRMQILKLNGHWNFMNATTWKTPGFETNDLGYMREADQIMSVLWAQYNQYQPAWIYRKFNINSDIYSVWNFGSSNTAKGYEWNANMDLKNFWSLYSGGALRSSSLDQTILRGGPMMKTPGNIYGRFGFTTDNRRKLVFNGYVNSTIGLEKCSKDFSTGGGISFKPTNWLAVSFNPGFSKSYCELQYVTSVNVNNKEKYIFASINRKTISTSFRVNLNMSPDLTLQYWGQPFFATGKYYNHKYISDPMAHDYKNRFRTYSPDQISLVGDSYNIDENVDGSIDYSFNRTDFNVQDFLSNLVIRWEYNPGSSVYFVWSQTRSSSNSSSNLDLFSDMSNLFSTADNKPHNVFLIKFSYRFGLK